LFRGFPPGEAAPPRRRPFPSCRWRLPAARRLPAERHEPMPRLQGFALHRDPLRQRRGLVVATTRSPHELDLLQVLPLLAVGGAFTSPPLVAFVAGPTGRSCVGLQRVTDAEPVCSLARATDLLEVRRLPSTH